ncbi:MAG TPA: hypothetical protein VN515_03885 [Terriglobales bacterium]|nr:hypothetical protein [Terriglobales bacterium]
MSDKKEERQEEREDALLDSSSAQESGAGRQQGRSRSEHSQAGGRQAHQPQGQQGRNAAGSDNPDEALPEGPIPHQQPIHNRDPRLPHTATRGAGSEQDEEIRKPGQAA